MPAIAWSALSPRLLGELFTLDGEDLDLGERYVLAEQLGAGGQGVVYAAEDQVFKRPVAIKLARHRQSPLHQEAELLGRLAHPTVPQVYDRGVSTAGFPFLVMQLIDGPGLDAWLATDPSPLRRIELFHRLGAGLAHAHARGILHRDLKPTNIQVIDDDQPVILDWGLSAADGKRSICGSPYFAAPEQLEGHPVGARADVYALGVLLYWLLAKELPYARHVSDFAEFRRVRAGLQVVPLRRRCPGLAAPIATLVMRAMSAQPGARPASVPAFMQELRLLEQQPMSALRRWLPVLLLASLVVGMALGWWAHASLGTSAGIPL